MNFNRFNLAIRRSLKAIVLMFACTLLMFSNAFPAMAIGTSPTSPREGDTQLNEIQDKSEDILHSDPLSLEDTQREANKGLNEIQGDANAEDMYTPENSKKAVTAADKVEEALENLTGKK